MPDCPKHRVSLILCKALPGAQQEGPSRHRIVRVNVCEEERILVLPALQYYLAAQRHKVCILSIKIYFRKSIHTFTASSILKMNVNKPFFIII